LCFRFPLHSCLGDVVISGKAIPPGRAWLPLTPRGVAAFAVAPWGRLLLAQGVVALFCAGVFVWFIAARWLPVAREAIARLPAGAAIRGARLQWTTNTPVRLAENRFLALAVDAQDTSAGGRVADLEITLHSTHLTARSLLGQARMNYPAPPGWVLRLDRDAAIPWWGAWETPLLTALGVTLALGLMALWFSVAVCYAPFIWGLGRLLQHPLGAGASWKLGGAALMPGALLLALGVAGYGAQALDLIRLGLVFLLHFVAGWVYVVAGACFVPPAPPAAERLPENPFVPQHEPVEPPADKEENPFRP
jgi:hypothetical protein